MGRRYNQAVREPEPLFEANRRTKLDQLLPQSDCTFTFSSDNAVVFWDFPAFEFIETIYDSLRQASFDEGIEFYTVCVEGPAFRGSFGSMAKIYDCNKLLNDAIDSHDLPWRLKQYWRSAHELMIAAGEGHDTRKLYQHFFRFGGFELTDI